MAGASLAHSFHVYVAGESPQSRQVVSNLEALCEQRLGKDDFEVEVIDVLGDPDRGQAQGILAAPTVVRVAPEPERRVVGDLGDIDAAAAALGLAPRGAADRGPAAGEDEE